MILMYVLVHVCFVNFKRQTFVLRLSSYTTSKLFVNFKPLSIEFCAMHNTNYALLQFTTYGNVTVVSLVGATWLGLKKALCVTSQLEFAAVSAT